MAACYKAALDQCVLHHSPLQCTTVHYNVPQSTTMYHSPLQCTTVHYNVPQSTTMYHSPLQCTTVHYNVPQSNTMYTVQYNVQCQFFTTVHHIHLLTSVSSCHAHKLCFWQRKYFSRLCLLFHDNNFTSVFASRPQSNLIQSYHNHNRFHCVRVGVCVRACVYSNLISQCTLAVDQPQVFKGEGFLHPMTTKLGRVPMYPTGRMRFSILSLYNLPFLPFIFEDVYIAVNLPKT